MKTILIVGTSFHTLRDYILSHGYEYVTLKDINLTKFPEKRLKRRIVCDFSSRESILKAVELVKEKYTIDAVIATYENYILPASIIAKHLNVPGIPLEAARACTDKKIMRQLFAEAPEKISPDFQEITSLDDALFFASKHDYPLIIKPANLSKSLLVTKSTNEHELRANYTKTMESVDVIYKKYAPNQTPKILIEEFMEGPIHSVDAFVDSDGTPHVLDAVVDYRTGYDIGYDDNFHYSRLLPSKLSSKDTAAIRNTAAIGCRALGMKNTPAHVEIILTKNGPMIVEIGARNGGYRERMHSLSNNLDITGAALDIALGKVPNVNVVKHNSSAVLELFPRQKGTFNGISNEATLRKLPSLKYVSIKARIGDYVGKSADGYKMCAVIIISNANSAMFDQDLHYIDQNVKVEILDSTN